MAYPAIKKISPEEYLEEERKAFEKHQYFDGDIVAMSGASIPHNRIVGNIIGELSSFLKGKHCDVFPSDLRVSVPEMNTYTYPDITIICGEPEVTDKQKDTVTNPTVIFEVLSGSTRDYDKGRKFLYYQKILSLKEYILIDSRQQAIIVYKKMENEHWDVSVLEGASAKLPISSIDCTISFSDIYRNVSFSKD